MIRPDGKPGKYFVLDEVNSVAIVAEDSDGEGGRIYLVGQTRYPIGQYSWEMITGGSKNEDPLAAAKREPEEEAGVIAKDWILLGYAYPVNGYSSEKTSIFLAKNLTKTETKFDDSEDITVKKESLNKILEMIEKNEISDGLTVFGLLKYLLYKKAIKQ